MKAQRLAITTTTAMLTMGCVGTTGAQHTATSSVQQEPPDRQEPPAVPAPAEESATSLAVHVEEVVVELEDHFASVIWYRGQAVPQKRACSTQYRLVANAERPCWQSWTHHETCESFLRDGRPAAPIQVRYTVGFSAADLPDSIELEPFESTRPADVSPTAIWEEPTRPRFVLVAAVPVERIELPGEIESDFRHETLTIRGNDRASLEDLRRLLQELRNVRQP